MKRPLRIALTALGLVLAQALGFLSPWGQALELRFLDLWFVLRGPIPPPSHVVIVAMDEESYQVLGFPLNQPWPRAAHARLLHRLARVGARRVVFDVLFLGPGPDPAADRKLAATLGGVPVVLGADLGTVEEGAYRHQTLLLPVESFRSVAAETGLVDLPEDGGAVRRFLTRRSELAQGLPSLAEAAVGSRLEPPPEPQDLLNYYGPPRTIPSFSYYQALDSELPLPPETFRDKLVFVGLTLRTGLGPAQKDAFLTPYAQSGLTSGVEIHATAAANLLTRGWIRRYPHWLEILGLSVLSAALGAALVGCRPPTGAAVLAGTAGGWATIAYAGFLHQVFLPGATLTLLVLPVGYLGTTLSYYIVTRRQQRQLERAFQFYLSPEMARAVARDPQAVRLGGEAIVATALFTDIEGFTTTAESLSADQVAAMLNAYFTEVMDAIFDQQGTLIKFIGDAVFALWGAPIKVPDHAQRACEAALAIQREIRRFNTSGRFPPLRTRIGLHTGHMMVGNFGSARRFDFTALGDTVNLASRVEGLNKYFGTEILLTDSVRSGLDGRLAPIILGHIRPVGKATGIGVHALFLEPVPAETQRRWNEALALFCACRWDTAAAAFSDGARWDPRLRKAAEFYADQITARRDKPLPPEWRGEIIFTTK